MGIATSLGDYERKTNACNRTLSQAYVDTL